MLTIVVVNNTKDWDIQLDNVEIVSAKTYLNGTYSDIKQARVYNLCRSYRYQSTGYYVSLLAEARGHQVTPNVTTIQDIKTQAIIKIISDEIDGLIQRSLSKIKSKKFHLSVYFGKNVAKQYDNLCRNLYNLFQVPLFFAEFIFKNNRWYLQNISPIPINEIPENHKSFAAEFAKDYFIKKRSRPIKKNNTIYDLGILINEEDKAPPSDKKAIQQFALAAESVGFDVEVINRDDFTRIAEFDALFIRETTSVNHHTYRFSRRAAAAGLVVLDDPDSIVKCTNKVYLTEVLNKARIPNPRTLVISKDNKHLVDKELGFPCVLKQPDSACSLGVIKVKSPEELQKELDNFLGRSELIVAQEYMPTEFDWRIGVLDNKPLYACKYYMAKDHWQIYNWQAKKSSIYGEFETLPLNKVPPAVLETAVKAASIIGDGLYGVDLKQVGDKVYVIEVNDNPSIDYGIEDAVMKDELYIAVAKSFLNRINKKKYHE